MTDQNAGIDAIEIHAGKLKLDLAETFAPEMGDDPGKYTKGLGQIGRASCRERV